MLVSMYVLCKQNLFDLHEKTCMQIISQLKSRVLFNEDVAGSYKPFIKNS